MRLDDGALHGVDKVTPSPATSGAGDRALTLPRDLVDNAGMRGREEWIAFLPSRIALARERWSLDAVGEPFEPGGQTAWVAPAHSAVFGEAVLKVAARHYEAFDEAKGLREWNGAGAVRLFAAEDLDETTAILLLERCRPGTALSERENELQDQAIAELLHRLWRE
ncbi:MAG: aminoglycoside phosphotransferase family protein, partial [Chloroflexota bacterium]